MVAYIDGEERREIDLELVYSGSTKFFGDWTVRLDGARLSTVFTPRPKDATIPPSLHLHIVTPWEKAGYNVSKFPFSRFYTDTGRHMLVQQLKRRPYSGQLQAGKWIYAMGKKNFDVKFHLSPGQRLSWEFEDDAMVWKFNGPAVTVEALPHNAKLPDYYPIFYSSDRRFDGILNGSITAML